MRRSPALILIAVIALGLCALNGSAATRSPVKVLCWNDHFPPPGPGSGPPNIRSTPKKCSLYRDGYNYEAAGAVHMRKLHWKDWGGRSAVAKGEFNEPMDANNPWKPIRLVLKRPTEDCGRKVYSKAVFFVQSVKSGFPIWTC